MSKLEAKGLLRSKTLWFNILVQLFLVLEANLNLIQLQLTSQEYLYVALFVTFVNQVLRMVTNQAVSFAEPFKKGRD